jgi:RHS repeat-associated protein
MQTAPNMSNMPSRSILASGKVICFLVLIWQLAPAAVRAVAQTGIGIQPNTTAIPVELGFLDTTSGNLHLEIPLGSFPQRGSPPFKAWLVYDSRIWLWISGGHWAPVNPGGTRIGGGWQFLTTNTAAAGWVGPNTQTLGTCYSGGTHWTYVTFTNFAYNANDGTTKSWGPHNPDSVQNASYNTSTPCGPKPATVHGMAADGSGYQLTANGSFASVVGPNGVVAGGNSNGNYYSQDANQNIVDTLDRTPIKTTSNCNGNANQICYDLLNSQGATSRVTLTTEVIPVSTNFGQLGVVEYSGTITVIQSIALPDGTSYSFNYDTGTTPGNYGELTRVTLSTGGQVNYAYTTFAGACGDDDSRWVNSRTSGGGAWSYTPQVVTTCGNPGQQQVTVTSPTNDNIVYTFLRSSRYASSLTQIQTYSGAVSPANLIASVANSWNVAGTQQLSETVSLPVPGGSINRTKQFTYDSTLDQNVSKLSEWKYYTGTLPSTPDRITSTVYTATDPNYPTYGNGNANILNRPTGVTFTDGSGTNQLAQTKYSYDSTPLISQTGIFNHDDVNFGTSNTIRGNQTQIQRWTGGTNYLTSAMTYDTTGQLRSVQDPAGNTTAMSYADNFFRDASGVVIPPAFTPTYPTNAYLTQVTLPVSGSVTYGYYYGTGKRALSKDQNNADSYTHFLDPLDRPTLSYGPALPSGKRPWTLATFSSTETQIDNYTAIGDATAAATCSSCTHRQTVLDNLGRTTSQELVNDPDGATFINTAYDSSGHIQSTSHPYRSTGDATYGLETPTYDALGRMTKMTHQDGTYSRTFYGAAVAGNGLGGVTAQLCSSTTYGLGYPVLVIDEAGKKRETWTDGFGNIIEVDEPDSSGNLASPTCYKYDLLGNLLQTVHGTQTRSYTYDPLSRVTSATVPEQAVGSSGTTNFYYTTSTGALCSGNPKQVCRRTDSRGITTAYTYDPLYRLTGKSYSDTTPPVTYSIDKTNCGTASLSNGLGRVTGISVADGSSSALWCYDAAGHLITDKRTIAGVTKTVSYTFNSDGSLASIGYPSGRTLTYNMGNAGRPLSAIDSNGVQYVLSPLLAGQSGWTYAPTGAVSSLVYGKVASGFGGITESRTYNNRLELTGIQATSTNGNALNLAPCNTPFSFGTGCSTSASNNDANLTGTTNNIDPGRSLTFINPDNTTYYDPLIRIMSVKTQATSGPDCWGQTFSDDALGNLLSVTTTQCSGFQLSVGVDANNHIITGGYSYDGAGNMTQDGSGYSYTYDAENRITSAAGVNYGYDANGLRVKKSNGTLYWRGFSGDVLAETDLSGNTISEYVFFAGRRVARRDSSTNVFFYNADSLGTTRTVTDATGHLCYDAEFTPYGTELIHTSTCPQNYKFTGYERDPETGLDYAFARYYNQRIGRFMSVDSMAGSILDPQTLNRYAYARNNPINLTDPSGLCEGSACLGQSNPHDPKSHQCSIDGAIAPCGMAFSLMGSGSAAWCPNNDCSSVLRLTDNGFTLRMPAGHLVLNAVQYADGSVVYSWSFWSRRFIQVASGGFLGPSDEYVTGEAARLAILSRAYSYSMQASKGIAVLEGLGLTGMVGGLAGAAIEAGENTSFFEGATYSEKVLQQMESGDFHSFPESVGAFEDSGTVTTILGNDGATYEMLEIPGSYMGRDGVFEFIKDSNGVINHRMFVPY